MKVTCKKKTAHRTHQNPENGSWKGAKVKAKMRQGNPGAVLRVTAVPRSTVRGS